MEEYEEELKKVLEDNGITRSTMKLYNYNFTCYLEFVRKLKGGNMLRRVSIEKAYFIDKPSLTYTYNYINSPDNHYFDDIYSTDGGTAVCNTSGTAYYITNNTRFYYGTTTANTYTVT